MADSTIARGIELRKSYNAANGVIESTSSITPL
jgi:hypothetical protein